MVQLLNPRVLVASLVLFTALIGCAHPKPAPAPMVYRPAPPPPPPPPPPPAKKVRLVVLPLEKLALPGTGEEINAKLAQVKLSGAEDATVATVSMETAQLQSECSEPTETCYLKIAQLVDADRLLWAQVEKVAGKGKKKAKKASTKIQIILFDREKLAVSGQSDGTFAGAITGENLDKLIATAIGVRPGPAEAPGIMAPPAASPTPAAAPLPVAPAMAPPAAHPATTALAPAAGPAYAPQPAAPAYAPQPAARQQAAASAPAAYPPPAAPPPAAYPPPAAAPPPAAYPPPAAAPPPAAYPPPAAAPPSYAPPAAAPPSAPEPSPARWQ